MMTSWTKLVSSSALALSAAAVSQSLSAQSTTTVETQAAEPALNSPADEATTGAAQNDVGDIIVTAQRREERLQDVPLTVSVVDSKQLDQQNITSVADLTRAVPALGASFLGTSPSIRGVSTGGFARSSEEAVSTVLDGVTLGRTAISQLFDVERVEVLSGPQGMLFGKNASAGVINITTVAPKFDRVEVIGHGDVGSYQFTRGQLTANLPVGGKAALRVSAFEAGDGSRVRNTRTGLRNYTSTWGGRARFRAAPTDNLDINLIADFEKTTGRGNFPFVVAILPTEDPLGTVTLDTQLAACGIVASRTNTLNCGTGISRNTARTKRYGFSGQIDYTLPGDYTLTSITAQRNLKTGEFGYFGVGGDTDMVPADILNRNITPSRYKVFTQELRIASPSDQFVDFVAGLYYFHSKNHDEIFQAGGLGYLPAGAADARYQIIDIDQKSYAAFGQATIHATEKLSLIAGGRYTNDKLRDVAPLATATQLQQILGSQGLVYVPVGFGAGFVPVNTRVKNDNFSWRLGARYEASPDFTTFFTASRGYKGPAISDQGARRDAAGNALDPIVSPEIPMNYELGMKATVLDRRLFIAATLYTNKIKNFQTQVFAPAIGIVPAGFVQGNAPFIRTRGIDINIFGRPFDGFTMNAGLLYNDAEYSRNFVVACAPQQTRGAGTCSAAGTTPAVSQVANSPKLRLLLNGEYAAEVSDTMTGYIQSDLQYQTKTFTSPNPDPNLRLPATLFLNGRVGLRTSDGRWSLSVFGRNLLNKRYYLYQQDFLALAGGGRLGVTPGSLPTYLTAPTNNQRTTIGLSVDFRY
jgi:iron complex outermembrane receptor protein